MHGEPKDVDGECNARLYIADNHGDNHGTMRCQKEPGHEGPHTERYESSASGQVEVTWEKDASCLCPKHGRVEIETEEDPCLVCYCEEHEDDEDD